MHLLPVYLEYVPNAWTWAEIIYYALLPSVLLSTVIADDFYRAGFHTFTLVLTGLMMPMLRVCIVNFLFGYQEYSYWYSLYSFMFILVLLPIKLFALCTMTTDGWETDRFHALTRRPTYVVYAWWILLAFGATHFNNLLW